MCRSLVGCFCSSSTGASIGEISRSKRPSSHARLARSCDSNPNASMSSRVMPRRLAIRSAAVNWSGRSMSHDSAPQDGAVRTRVGAQPDPAHRLDSARDADVDGTRRDQPGDQVVGLLAAAALAVDGRGADVLGQPRDEPAHPGDVVGLLAVLRDAAADDLLDSAGVDAGLFDQRLLHRAQQLGGVQS